MVQIFPPQPVLQPFVACYNVLSGYFDTYTESILSARGVPMLMFPFNTPSISTFTHGDTGIGYTKPLLDEPILLTCSNIYGRSTFQGHANFGMILLKTTGAYTLTVSSKKGFLTQKIVKQ